MANSSIFQEDSENSGNLSDGSDEETPISRPLSPSQYFGSLMKPSGSREKLFALAATASPASVGSTSFSLSTTLPLRQDTATDMEGDTDSDIDRCGRGQNEWAQQRLKRTPTVEAGKSAGSPNFPAGSSSFPPPLGSVDKQATARQVAAELIRQKDLSLSAPLFLRASGTMDNSLPSQVSSDFHNELEHEGKHRTAYIEEQRARLQMGRAGRTEAPKIMESSSSVQHVSVEEHALSNERRRKELQDLQGGTITEEQREE
jgi:hypothetical protein